MKSINSRLPFRPKPSMTSLLSFSRRQEIWTLRHTNQWIQLLWLRIPSQTLSQTSALQPERRARIAILPKGWRTRIPNIQHAQARKWLFQGQLPLVCPREILSWTLKRSPTRTHRTLRRTVRGQTSSHQTILYKMGQRYLFWLKKWNRGQNYWRWLLGVKKRSWR